METTLILAKIIFYFAVSAAVIALGVLTAIVAYHLIRITRELENLARNINHVSSEAGEKINDIINKLSALPILSYFLRKKSIKKTKRR